MQRGFLLAPAAAVALGLLAPAGVADHGVVRVFNWPDYIADETVARFEAETGLKVVYETFPSNEVLNEVVTLGTAFYDVVMPSSTFLDRQVRAGVYRPLDPALIPNLARLDADLVTNAAREDPASRHGAIYLWGTSGLGYNRAMVAERLGPDASTDSWALLFDPANAARLADCGIAILDSGTEVVPLVLTYLGLPHDSAEPAHLAAAEAALAAIRPYVAAFDSESYLAGLADGSLCLALGWSGDIIAAREDAARNVDIAYSVPREGTTVWFDMLAIPLDAPNPLGAHAFIDFLLRPDVIAEITNAVYFPNAVPDAWPMIARAVREDPAVYPDATLRNRLFPQPAYDTLALREIARLWKRVRGG